MTNRTVAMAAKIVLGLEVLALLALAISGPFTKYEIWHFRYGLLALAGAMGLSVAALVAALVWVILSRVKKAADGGKLVAGTSVVALGLAAILGLQAAGARAVPPIHDITTDTANPPAFVAVLPLRANAMNPPDYKPEVAEKQKAGYPDLAPLTVSASPKQVFDRALEVAKAMGWEIVAAEATEFRIEATATTAWMGFKDDVVIRLTAEGDGTKIDMRSKSRVGVSDVGANAKRIRAFLSEMAKKPA